MRLARLGLNPRPQSVRNHFVDSQTFKCHGTVHARVSRRASRFGFCLCDPGTETALPRITPIPSPQIGMGSSEPGTDTGLLSRLPIHPRGDGKRSPCSYPPDSSTNVFGQTLRPQRHGHSSACRICRGTLRARRRDDVAGTAFAGNRPRQFRRPSPGSRVPRRSNRRTCIRISQ